MVAVVVIVVVVVVVLVVFLDLSEKEETISDFTKYGGGETDRERNETKIVVV